MKSGKTAVIGHDALMQVAARVAPGISAEIRALGEQIQARLYVGVPLFVRGHTIGVMAFGTTAQDWRRDYQDADAALVEEFARRVSSAVENARLFRKADELNRLKNGTSATLSHEMRTPLSAAPGWSRMLATGQLDPTKHNRRLRRFSATRTPRPKIVDDILDVARGMKGNLRLDLSDPIWSRRTWLGRSAIAGRRRKADSHHRRRAGSGTDCGRSRSSATLARFEVSWPETHPYRRRGEFIHPAGGRAAPAPTADRPARR